MLSSQVFIRYLSGRAYARGVGKVRSSPQIHIFLPVGATLQLPTSRKEASRRDCIPPNFPLASVLLCICEERRSSCVMLYNRAAITDVKEDIYASSERLEQCCERSYGAGVGRRA